MLGLIIEMTGDFLYEYKGFTAIFTKEAISDALDYHGIDIIRHITKMIDRMAHIADPFEFRVVVGYDIEEYYTNHNIKLFSSSTKISIIPK